MNIIEYISDWMLQNPTATSVIKYCGWVTLIVICIQSFRRLIKRKVPDTSFRYKSQKAVEIFGYALIILLSISYLTGTVKDLTLAIGLLTAGITITLQELILSIAGSLYIFVVRVYKPGDRIEINGIKGDVIDIDSVYTTMMEIGEWVSSDNYSGRIVKLSNAFVFKGPIYNYSQDFPFIWDEFNLPIRYGSDVDLAKSIISKIVQETLSDYAVASTAKWKEIVDKYYIEEAQVQPSIAISLTDSWIQFNIRYIVDYKKRRLTKHILNEKIGNQIRAKQSKVALASATLEVVNIPILKVDQT